MVFTEHDAPQPQYLDYKITKLEIFYKMYTEEFPKLLGIVEWDVIHYIDLESRKFNSLIHAKSKFVKLDSVADEKKNLKDLAQIDSLTKKLYESAISIYCKLDEHKEALVKKYYSLSKQP
jgi:hypothetical protein